MTGGALNSVEIIPTGVLEHLVAADRRGLHRPARAQHQNRASPASKRWSVVSILGQTLTGDRGFESVSLQRRVCEPWVPLGFRDRDILGDCVAGRAAK
jgi:hypothetical protein